MSRSDTAIHDETGATAAVLPISYLPPPSSRLLRDLPVSWWRTRWHRALLPPLHSRIRKNRRNSSGCRPRIVHSRLLNSVATWTASAGRRTIWCVIYLAASQNTSAPAQTRSPLTSRVPRVAFRSFHSPARSDLRYIKLSVLICDRAAQGNTQSAVDRAAVAPSSVADPGPAGVGPAVALGAPAAASSLHQ